MDIIFKNINNYKIIFFKIVTISMLFFQYETKIVNKLL